MVEELSMWCQLVQWKRIYSNSRKGRGTRRGYVFQKWCKESLSGSSRCKGPRRRMSGVVYKNYTKPPEYARLKVEDKGSILMVGITSEVGADTKEWEVREEGVNFTSWLVDSGSKIVSDSSSASGSWLVATTFLPASSCEPSPRMLSMHCHFVGGLSWASTTIVVCCSGNLDGLADQVSLHKALDILKWTFMAT